MENEISEIVGELQSNKLLPNGEVKYISWDRQFSRIHKLTFKNQIFYIKKLKPRHDQKDKKLKKRLENEYFALNKVQIYLDNFENFNVPKPIYFSTEKLILVTEGLKGSSIIEIARKCTIKEKEKKCNGDKIFFMVGQFSKILHAMETKKYELESAYKLLRYIEKRIKMNIFSEKEILRIMSFLYYCIDGINKSFKNYEECYIHHDFSPGNILYDYDTSSVNVLDLGDFRFDHKYQDICYFRMMIERQLNNRIKYKRAYVDKLINAFSNGYNFNYSILERDNLYVMYKLKNLSIFAVTLSMYLKGIDIRRINSKKMIKYFSSLYEYKTIKKEILNVVRG